VVEAFRHHSPDMLRVVCMALMNVIPVVATIFGAAYAVQPAYGIGFAKDMYLWIPVVGNIVAVLVIPMVGNLSDRIGRRPPSSSARCCRGCWPSATSMPSVRATCRWPLPCPS
jgi:MFS family permease